MQLQRITQLIARAGGITAIACAVVLAGCSTIAREQIPAFRTAVATANLQTQQAFADVNRMLRDQQIDRAVTLPALNAETFVEGLAAKDRAVWARTFTLMESYAENLDKLLSPDRRAGVEKELQSLGEQLMTLAPDQFTPGVGAAFVQIGGFLTQAKANTDARKIVTQVNQSLQTICKLMADAIGPDPRAGTPTGVRGTVHSAWMIELAVIDTQFKGQSEAGGKRKSAVAYAKALDDRDAHDHALASVRESVLTIGRAHQALADGRMTDAAGLVRIIQEEYRAAREQMDYFKKKREEALAGNPQP